MRGTRWLLVVAMVALVAGVGITYRSQKRAIRAEAPPRPQPLPGELNSASENWHVSHQSPGRDCPDYYIGAQNAKQLKDSLRIDLTSVSLKIYKKSCDAYDLVKSAAASYYPNDHRFFSDGDVEITLNIPLAGQPTHTPVSIRTSGVTVDTETYRAETDRPATYTFERGNGKGTGATYDPSSHELLIKNDVEVHWEPEGPHAKAMKINAASLVYHENASEILLNPWGKLTRDNTVVEGENVVIHLQSSAPADEMEKKKMLHKQVQTAHAHGTDEYPNRKLQYAADQLLVDFDNEGEIQKITGQDHARLISTSETAETTMLANHVELNFVDQDNQSILTQVLASGQGTVTSKPLPGEGRQPAETDILRSEQIEMKMRPGGREIESMVTHGPGSLEFLPNLPAQHHRTLEGNDIAIAYGPRNRVDWFRATGVRTHTDPNEEERKHNRTAALTSSRDLTAHFDPQTSKISTMDQSGDFRYEEGDRRARATKATLDSNQNVMVLDGSARIWDATGSTAADQIRMDQRTGDFVATGNVNSSRLPDQDPKKNSQILSGDEPLQAQARKMVSTNHNRTVHYEGRVSMWQGANRIEADTIDLDREKRNLVAAGNVVSNLWEQPKDDNPKKKAPVLTVVHAPRLVYTEENRLADYSGGVTLDRPGMKVKCKDLRAFMAEEGADSRLEKAFADGSVEIVQTAPARVRTGTAEHSEYYTDDQKVILRGGQPRLLDVLNGKTDRIEGNELTYFANDDRLLGSGAPNQPVESRIIRKRK